MPRIVIRGIENSSSRVAHKGDVDIMSKAIARYYAIKHKKDKRWVAYKITKQKLKTLHDDYEFRGPFNSVFKAIVGVNKQDNRDV